MCVHVCMHVCMHVCTCHMMCVCVRVCVHIGLPGLLLSLSRWPLHTHEGAHCRDDQWSGEDNRRRLASESEIHVPLHYMFMTNLS